MKKPLAPGMEQVWQMMHDENAQECLQTLTEEGIVGYFGGRRPVKTESITKETR